MKKSRRFRQFEKRHLLLVLGIFFVTLIIPTSVLVYQAYDQFKWEAFHNHQQLAEETALRIDNAYINLINEEEKRPFTDYIFLNIVGDQTANIVQRSPLSNLEYRTSIPGLIGYFQVDEKGQFTSPLLPVAEGNVSSFGISKKEFAQRQLVTNRVQEILKTNELIRAERGIRLAEQSVGGKTAPSKDLPAPSQEPPASTGLAGRSTFTQKPKPSRMVEPEPAPALEAEAPAATAEFALTEPAEEMDQISSTDSQSAFDELAKQESRSQLQTERGSNYSLGKVEDLGLEKKYELEQRARQQSEAKSKILQQEKLKKKRSTKRKEQNILPEDIYDTYTTKDDRDRQNLARIQIFESEIDPFEFSLLKSGEFVLFRKAWRNENRYIQGIIYNSQDFITRTIIPIYQNTTLAQASDLAVAYNGDILSVVKGSKNTRYNSSVPQLDRTGKLKGALLYRTRLSPPLNDIELVFSIRELPTGPGGRLIILTTIILLAIFCVGFFLLYRLGARQIDLSRQQQDFVSAVSHELKTPLTSIRMYGEMLREGWANEEKKRSYYDFIYYESERLSRLIQNVLQLARMTRNEIHADLAPIKVSELIDMIRSKVSSQVERNGFELALNCSENAQDKFIEVDADYFSQIIINLVDNAIKFSKDAEQKRIEISCHANDGVVISIRDYGPGIAKDQLKKIFSLFYRSENELTRKTVGTGIGLALVHQMMSAMHAEIDVINHNPGAEFLLSFTITQNVAS